MEEFILKERETRETISNIITSSGLPAVTLKSIFVEFLEMLKMQEQYEYSQAQAIRIKKEKENKKKGAKTSEKGRNNNS